MENQKEIQMSDSKICPKCNGSMAQGKIMKHNEVEVGDQSLYVFAADEDSGSSLSSALKSAKNRKALVAFACDDCGFTEFYSQPL
jgi:predicted nucleic-acid-binding Zn-ribbon protein